MPANDSQPLLIPFGTKTIDGDRTDWSGVPVYALTKACSDCVANEDGQGGGLIVSPTSVPLPDDLAAYFRVAWDTDSFYVFADVFDDHLVQSPGSDPKQEDTVALFFDGLDDRAPGSGYGDDDNRIFLGLSNTSEAFNRPINTDQRDLTSKRNGNFCYRVEARISWGYIVGSAANSRPDKFPPAPGATYGFDISVNDWDPSLSDLEEVQRQSQVFWVDPKTGYRIRSQGFGGIRLVGAPDAGTQ